MKVLKVCHFTAKDENLGPPELRGQKMSAKSSLDLEPKNKEERKDGHWHEADGRCQAVKLEQLHKSTMCGTSQLLDVFQCLMLPFSIVISSKTIKNQKAQIMWDLDVFLLYVLLLDKLGGSYTEHVERSLVCTLEVRWQVLYLFPWLDWQLWCLEVAPVVKLTQSNGGARSLKPATLQEVNVVSSIGRHTSVSDRIVHGGILVGHLAIT